MFLIIKAKSILLFNPSPTAETPQNTGGNKGEGVGEAL